MSGFQIESVAQWLAKLLVQEVQYLAEVEDKVEELQSELEWMQCFLLDADKKQNKSAIVRKWVLEIRDLAQKAEDVIETYILDVSHKKQKSRHPHAIPIADLMWFICVWMDANTLHGIGSEIDALTVKISKLSSRLQTYGIKSTYDITSSALHRERLSEERRTYSHTYEGVIGLEERVNDLADKLVMGQQKVLVIHGMGGIGKTTLAREVYRHAPLKNHFAGFAWAYISQNLQLGSVCREILLQLIPRDEEEERKRITELQDSQLPGKLCDVLKNMKCLVILDDIWFARDWNCIAHAFPLNDDSCGSKLVVTTRNREILSGYGDPVVWFYETPVLREDLSYQLLQKKANFQQDNPDALMVKLANKMLSHCDGHPLAIVVLGGILATRKTIEQWQSVYDNLPSYLQGHELYSGVYEVLAMSYYELPYNLKPCFLHLAYFPEDFAIPTEKLYHLWIAEGIVSPTQDRAIGKTSLEDAAKMYLNDLVQKGMVQAESWDSDGQIRTCQLHDLMRDKCVEIAEEENFLQIVAHRQRKAPQNYALNERLRRLSMWEFMIVAYIHLFRSF